MEKKPASVQHFTFHRILTGCERGDRNAWQAFLSGYTPIILNLISTYFPKWSGETKMGHWQDTLDRLKANDCERLRALDHQAEREFLIDLRSVSFELAAAKLDRADDVSASSPPTFEAIVALFNNLPLSHQEIIILKLSGYSDPTIEQMLLLPSSAIQKALLPIAAHYAVALGRSVDACLWPAAWQEILAEARKARKPECPQPRIFVRILEGHISWYEKTPAEEHMARCLHCLEYWVALREVNFLRRELQPHSPIEIETLLGHVCPGALAVTERSWVQRIFSR